jgi:hypothetical protein
MTRMHAPTPAPRSQTRTPRPAEQGPAPEPARPAVPLALDVSRVRDRAPSRSHLPLGRPDDPLERQADAIAAAMTAGSARVREGGASPAEPEKDAGPFEPARPNGTSIPGLGAGRPIAPADRSFFEPRFGRDFSGVRLHDDERASGLAGSVGARAFTVGGDIVFRRGEAGNSASARRLLAHELTHVAQQSGGGLTPAGRIDRAPAVIQRDLLDDVTGAVSAAYDRAKQGAYEALINGLLSAKGASVAFLRKTVGQLPASLQSVGNTMVDVADACLDFLVGFTLSLVGLLVGFGEGVVGLITGLLDIGYKTLGFFRDVIRGLFKLDLSAAEADLKALGTAIVGLPAGLKALATAWRARFEAASLELKVILISELGGQVAALLVGSFGKLGSLGRLGRAGAVAETGAALGRGAEILATDAARGAQASRPALRLIQGGAGAAERGGGKVVTSLGRAEASTEGTLARDLARIPEEVPVQGPVLKAVPDPVELPAPLPAVEPGAVPQVPGTGLPPGVQPAVVAAGKADRLNRNQQQPGRQQNPQAAGAARPQKDGKGTTNRMRFQVQWGRGGKKPPQKKDVEAQTRPGVVYSEEGGYTFAKSVLAPEDPGVTRAQAIEALEDVVGSVLPDDARRQAVPPKQWWITSFIANVVGDLRGPISRTAGERNKMFKDQTSYPGGRVDVENNAGANLKV